MRATLELQLTTIDPLHITAPEKDYYYSLKTRKVVAFGRGDGMFPLTMTRKVSFAEKLAEDGAGRVSVPFIPSNTIRGGLRRQIAGLYFDQLEKEGKKLSLDAFHCLTSGAPHGNPDSFTSIKDIQRYMADPYFGLLGGGPKIGVASQLRVRAGFPICPSTTGEIGVPLVWPKVLPELQGTDTDWLTEIQPIRRKDDACRQSMTNDAKRIVEDLATAVDSLENAINSDKKKAKDEGSDESTSRGLNGLNFAEVVVPKTPFYLRFDLVGSQEYNVGLFLLGLQRLLQEPIGGKAALGYGNFVVNKVAIQIDGETSTPVTTDPSTWDQWFEQEGQVGTCVQAARDVLADIDIAELEDMCRPKQIGKKKTEPGE